MATLLAVLLSAVVLAVGSMRPDSPTARPLGWMWADLRRTAWWRIAWALICIFGGGPFVILFAAARAALYGLGVAVAAACCWAASHASLAHRPVRVHLEFA